MPQLSLLPCNEEAWKLWNILSGQQNTNGGRCGPLIFASVQFVFDLYEVGNRREVFEKIQLIHGIYIEKLPKE